MKPGDLVLVHRFGEPILCIYIGPGSRTWKFLVRGKIAYFDLQNKSVYRYEVISD